MAARPSIALVAVGALCSLGASYRSQNFVVEAPTPQFAQQVAQYAENYRREKAMQWLGMEMRPWGQPCPLRVTVTMNGSGGATSFAFDKGAILSMDMHIEGSADRLLASVLPHEVTHTVFAYYYRTPMPRWADEGGAVLSEDELERSRHDQLVRQILSTPGRAFPLRRLFALRDYPRDVMVLYAEGYSVTNFLVGLSDRPTFLRFVAQGMNGDWDGAVRAYYHFNTIEDLERAWVRQLSSPRTGATLAADRSYPDHEARPARVLVRQTLPPAPPLLDAPQPVYRGQAPSADDSDPRSPGRPTSYPRPSQSGSPGWPGPPTPPAPRPPSIQLLAPQLEPAQVPAYPRSPVGYSP
jgi:hypothetical protein